MSRRLAASVAVLCTVASSAVAQPVALPRVPANSPVVGPVGPAAPPPTTTALPPAAVLPPPNPALRRPVAVVDLTLGTDPRVGDLAHELFAALSASPELEPLEARSVAYASALLGVPPDDDQQRIASAQTALETAEAALARYDSNVAESAAETGMVGLSEVAPRLAAQRYAQLAFVRGQAFLGKKKAEDAARSFSLVWAITPDRTLDPNQLFPEVIDAYRGAKPAGSATLDVRGVGEIWIDGVAYGAAPHAITVVAGRHVVQLTGVERLTRGSVVDVGRGESLVVSVLDAPAADDVKIRRARRALADAKGDTVARASTMGRLAKLIDVGDAVLVSQQDGKLMVQTWRDRSPGFTRDGERGTRTAEQLLAPLAPPPPPKEKDPPPIVIPPEDPRWYQSRRVQVVTAAGVIVVVAAAILWARMGQDMIVPGRNLRPSQ